MAGFNSYTKDRQTIVHDEFRLVCRANTLAAASKALAGVPNHPAETSVPVSTCTMAKYTGENPILLLHPTLVISIEFGRHSMVFGGGCNIWS